MKQKPRLSFWQIWNMSFGFLGIQFGFALQNANVSRIFETLDAKIDDIPILWLAAPVTGLIIQPIIGHLSDNTWGRFGRRRPYFLIGAILASICLIFMPHSSVLWMAAGTLWILDASINISMEPFRAFVGDMLPNKQRTSGFAMQSFFIGVGAVVGSMLPWVLTNWLNIPNTAPKGIIPPSVQYSFYFGAAVFISAILVTVLKTKEYSPEQLEEFQENQDINEINEHSKVYNRNVFIKLGGILGIIGLMVLFLTYYFNLEKELYILGGILVLFCLSMIIVYVQKKNPEKHNMIIDVFSDLITMPKTMKQLAVVQFFSWFALFSMWIYTVSGVTSTKYDMNIDNSFNEYLINKTISLENQLSKKEDILKLLDIKKELEKNKSKLLKNNSISTSVNLANYFLDNKIYTEKSLIDSFSVALGSINLSNNEFLDSKKELNELKISENPNISFKTLNYINKNKPQNLDFLKSVDFQNYLRLKEIRQNYNDGADWVGILFGIYNLFAAGFAFLLIGLAKITNRKITHAISLIVGGLSLISIYFIHQPTTLIFSFIGIGLVWASILSMPYAILTSALPSKKMGVYMGIFNFFIVLPQILAATILGFMVKKLFNDQAIFALIVGGLSMIIAAIMVIFVKDNYYSDSNNNN